MYKIIGTGSKGNAVIINNILVDCGVPYKELEPYMQQIKLVLLTHTHGDHFKQSTVKRLATERPSLRFAGGEWMVPLLVESGVSMRNIDILTCDKMYDYTLVSLVPVKLNHDVPNCGYKLLFGTEKVFYATDTNDLNGIEAKEYDLYFVEANYEDEEIHQRIKEKEMNGEYAYEKKVLQNHLSKKKSEEWIYSNAGMNSQFIYIHQHC